MAAADLVPRQNSDPYMSRYGLTTDEAYVVALALHRREKNYLDLNYEQKNNLSAFYKQATYGTYQADKAPISGWLDLVGNDRRKAWEQLGNISSAAAKAGFCQLMFTASGKSFETALLKGKRDKFNRIERQKIAKREAERQKRLEEEAKKTGDDGVTLLARHEEVVTLEKKQREAVYNQQQRVLEKQHTAPKVKLPPATPSVSEPPTEESSVKTPLENGSGAVVDGGTEEEQRGQEVAAAAAIWTRPGVNEFRGSSDCKSLLVARGDALCVRVPIATLDKSMFWQFASVDYDISFSVSYQEGSVPGEDKQSSSEETAAMTELLPLRRVDSHLEVICGSHTPTQLGYYLLRFDNSYSYWRSKTVYFHVYCAASS